MMSYIRVRMNSNGLEKVIFVEVNLMMDSCSIARDKKRTK